jgi:hypothetical protein
MRRLDPSPGQQHPIRSWKKSSDYVNVFPGHNTSFLLSVYGEKS